MEIAPYISVNSSIHNSTPVITSTRVPVSIIIRTSGKWETQSL
jgi:uncharacterized protein (DUF433 family)